MGRVRFKNFGHRRFKRSLGVLSLHSARNGRQGQIVKVNVDHEQQLAQKFGIYNILTLLFFKSGTLREQVVGSAA